MSDNNEKSEPTAGPSKSKNRRLPLPPEFDLRSELFDPLKALNADEKYFNVKNVKVYDNIAKFETAMKGDRVGKSKETTDVASTSRSGATSEPTNVRRFLPHQGVSHIIIV